MEKTHCVKCGTKIRAFKTHFDWNGRALHKKCWKEEQDELAFKIQMELYKIT